MTTEPARIYRRVVFLQGDDGRKVVDSLTRTEGVLVRGATDATIGECITALAEGDDGWSGEITTDPSGGARDHVTERDLDGILYRLTWNVGLGYVGLEEVLMPGDRPVPCADCYPIVV